MSQRTSRRLATKKVDVVPAVLKPKSREERRAEKTAAEQLKNNEKLAIQQAKRNSTNRIAQQLNKQAEEEIADFSHDRNTSPNSDSLDSPPNMEGLELTTPSWSARTAFDADTDTVSVSDGGSKDPGTGEVGTNEEDSDDEELRRLEEQVRLRKEKKQAAKVSVRNDIMVARNSTPKASTKRNRSNTETDSIPLKRSKPVDLGGLKSGWKKSVHKPPKSNSHSRHVSAELGMDDIEFETVGVFDEDESPEMIEEQRAAKSYNKVVKKDVVQVKLEAGDVNAIVKEERDTGKPAKFKPPKTHVKVADVPFIKSSDQTVWNNTVRTGLIEWSGSISKQFNINSDPNFRETVMDLWNKHINVLPHVPSQLEHDGSMIHRCEHPAILSFAQADIRNYRSNVGKTAIRVLKVYLMERADTIEERREVVEDLLHHNAFVYEKPGKTRNESSGAFRGELVMHTFAFFLSWSYAAPGINKPTAPAGALALATTAVLRALEASRSSNTTEPASPADSQTTKKKKPANSPDNFGDQWGPQAAKFYYDILKLGSNKWELIMKTSEAYIPLLPNAGAGPYLKEARQIQESLAHKRKGKQPEIEVAADDEIIVSD
ncbi:hypothetical protein F5878DRAFT_641802 [Lentinula raphanica]|uniref:DUF6532 domain-containing protein n=1 Tax=Lentinula raphanica TaxID=153919 RepID=A0AA38P988_9AGAR|nr:hypothetical protein F5878DRAFT_641802 [Lentinula raphanica]